MSRMLAGSTFRPLAAEASSRFDVGVDPQRVEAGVDSHKDVTDTPHEVVQGEGGRDGLG